MNKNNIKNIKKLYKFFIIVGFLLLSSILIGALIFDNYVIDGNKVYIDDSNVYISAEPHTFYKNGYIIFKIWSSLNFIKIDNIVGKIVTLIIVL